MVQWDVLFLFVEVYSNGTSPEFCALVQPWNKADNILAEAVAHEEHSVLSNVGYEGRCGALIEPSQSNPFIDWDEAVDKASVQAGESLHLHLGCIKGLPA